MTGIAKLTFPAVLMLGVGQVYAFTDLNDTLSQQETIEQLQKRIDSLEVRMTKTELERLEARNPEVAKKGGLLISMNYKVPSPLMMNFNASYGFKRKKKDGGSYHLGPTIGLEYESLQLQLQPLKTEFSYIGNIGILKRSQLVDRFSYSAALRLKFIPKKNVLISAIGPAADATLHLWVKSGWSLDFGVFQTFLAMKENNSASSFGEYWKTGNLYMWTNTGITIGTSVLLFGKSVTAGGN